MKYLVTDPGFMNGKERNPVFATNSKKEAIKAANDSGAGFVVIRLHDGKEKIVYISPYKKELELPV